MRRICSIRDKPIVACVGMQAGLSDINTVLVAGRVVKHLANCPIHRLPNRKPLYKNLTKSAGEIVQGPFFSLPATPMLSKKTGERSSGSLRQARWEHRR